MTIEERTSVRNRREQTEVCAKWRESILSRRDTWNKIIRRNHPPQPRKRQRQTRPPISFAARQTERLVRHHTQPCTPKSSAASNDPLATSHCTSKTQSRPATKPGLRSPGYAALLKSFSKRSPVSRAAGAPGTPTRCCDIRDTSLCRLSTAECHDTTLLTLTDSMSLATAYSNETNENGLFFLAKPIP